MCPGAYEPPDSIGWLEARPCGKPIAELLRQAPPPVRKLPPANARVPIAELRVSLPSYHPSPRDPSTSWVEGCEIGTRDEARDPNPSPHRNPSPSLTLALP